MSSRLESGFVLRRERAGGGMLALLAPLDILFWNSSHFHLERFM